MSYFKLKSQIPNTKWPLDTIFCDHIPFRIAIAEKLEWKIVIGISKENVKKYHKYFTLLTPSQTHK